MKPKFYMHSKCCERHWEMTLNKDGKLGLQCELCNLGVGPNVELSPLFDVGPVLPENSDTVVCLHSRCCHKHWEIVFFDDNTVKLVCADCGEIETEILVELKNMGEIKCEKCGEDCHCED